MEYILSEASKISFYAHIQKELCALSPNANDEEINILIDQIPENYLNQKENLMIICQLFAYYPRNSPKKVRRNVFKLFDKIMIHIKTHMQGQSTFFWNIFGGLFYFKQYMYDEGLISIDNIVQEAVRDNLPHVSEYFLPEIIEKSPEIFEYEIKHKIRTQYSEQYIKEFKELRRKHLKWLRESNDYHDPSYKEIEKNRLRLAIKTDDIEIFQSILSYSNLSVNSEIEESALENSYFRPAKVQLIKYAIEFDSIKIFKYLIMNDAIVDDGVVFYSIRNQNLEIIHIVESKANEQFKKMCLNYSIDCWNYELAVYSAENYDSILEDEINEEENEEKYKKIFGFISVMCYSINFQFFESMIIPFLQKNSQFVEKNINEIVFCTLQDQSAYFLKMFMKYPNVDINYHSFKNNDQSNLCHAIYLKNLNAVEFILSHPDVDLDKPGHRIFLPFQFACVYCNNIKVFEMFCNYFNNQKNLNEKIPLNVCIVNNNFIAIDFFLNHLNGYDKIIPKEMFFYCLNHHYLISLKMILKYTKVKHEDKIIDIAKNLQELPTDLDKLNMVLNELNIKT